MKNKPLILKGFIAAWIIFLSLIQTPPATAQPPMVEIGRFDFESADGASRECRIKDLSGNCTILGALVPPWFGKLPVPGWLPGVTTPESLSPIILTESNATKNFVSAAFTTIDWTALSVFGVPYYATSWVYNDFEIVDTTGKGLPVNVQISTTYFWEGGIWGAQNYEGRFSLSLEIEDITDPSNPMGIGSFDLVSRDRSGDLAEGIGFSAIAYDRNKDTASFQVRLLRGKTYRIYFKAEAFGAPLAVTGVEAGVRAKWTELAVTVETDASEMIAIHDAEIKARLSEIQQDLTEKIATHDLDIKARLSEIQQNLEEIKRLLNTPPGRREDFPIKEPKPNKNK